MIRMIVGSRRNCLKRACISTSRLLLPSTTPLSPPPLSPPPGDRHPFLAVAACLRFCTNVSTMPHLANWFIDNVKRRSFSTQGSADVLVTGIVEVPLAQTGEGIAECELLKWYVQEGDLVEEFQPLCEVQSDKATIEITSRYKGKVAHVLYAPGDIVKVGETLLKMFVEDSLVSMETSDKQADRGSLNSDTVKESSLGFDLRKENFGILATPAVRNLAKQYGINLSNVPGTGIDGRIFKEDVIKYAIQIGVLKDSSGIEATYSEVEVAAVDNKHGYASAVPVQHYEDEKIPLRGFMRTMVKTMSSAAKVPHFHYVEEIKCDALVRLKESFQNNNNDSSIKYTFLPILIKSLSMALSKYPWMNSCFNDEFLEVTLKGSHNIGIAMATPNGLVVPNIKNAQSLSILEITKEISRLQQLAVNNKLCPEDVTGGTITVSNIGAIGGKFGSPIINLPEVAIIALGRIQKVAHFADDGRVHPLPVMNISIGADHRVLDGATVARFCNEWKQFIESPDKLTLLMR
ncbi:hypothetical protein K2173_007824 [Erythroxylum novogranatense]|uniref:Dihydrolipoamide acetyltransferase component of pyruvate dehydrogenase complex n=1 Tax=Erythroxylum novogranatense TaxID=1862640 RepID=A0AAV8TIT3_9ROSI|nr:hypothetical protein K2173_007824 [Erythroxylum novogranatense]